MLSDILIKMLAVRSVPLAWLALMSLMLTVILLTSLGARPSIVQVLILLFVGAILSGISVAVVFVQVICEEETKSIE